MNALASEAVSTAKTALFAALRRGEDTLKPRKELSQAEQAAERERAANASLMRQMQKSRADAIRKDVDAECSRLKAEIEAECAAVLPGFEVQVAVESHRLVMLLEARARRDEVETARAELEHDFENLRVRLGEVESQIAAIHASDDRSDAAMGRVHMLGLDRSDIQALVEAAGAQLEELTLPALGDLERGWQAAKTEARFRALHQIMSQLEARLLQCAALARDTLGPGQYPDLRYRPCALMRQAAQQTIV